MTKIMLVEDDNNLREIYEARLAAEGYTIVSAQDGEAALALAAKERPDLVITDVMMPKISGFEMLDIMRNTENLRDVKVIMLTALGQIEDSARASSLGADRYLVKSQVTLEDIVKATHEVLDVPDTNTQAGDFPAAASPAPAPDAEPAAPDEAEPKEARAWKPAAPETPEAEPADDTTTPEPSESQEPEAAAEPLSIVEPPQLDDSSSDDSAAPADDSAPASDDKTRPDDNSDQSDDLAAETPEEPPEEPSPPAPEAVEAEAPPAAEEEAVMRAQIDQFLDDNSDDAAPESAPAATAETTPEAADKPKTPPTVEAEAGQPPAEESDSEYDKDAASPDMGELDVQDHDGAPADESDEEYDKDDRTPDNGELDVQPKEETPATEPPSVEALPGDPNAPLGPSQTYELPVVAEPSAEPVATSPWARGDKLVNDAVDNMNAHAPAGSAYVPTENPVTLASPPTSEATPETTPETAPEAPVGSAPQPAYPTDTGTHKRVISPLGLTESKPDINQLLALEEAKNAARQAGTYQQPAPGTAPGGQAQPGQTPQPGPGFDPNSISL